MSNCILHKETLLYNNITYDTTYNIYLPNICTYIYVYIYIYRPPTAPTTDVAHGRTLRASVASTLNEPRCGQELHYRCELKPTFILPAFSENYCSDAAIQVLKINVLRLCTICQ